MEINGPNKPGNGWKPRLYVQPPRELCLEQQVNKLKTKLGTADLTNYQEDLFPIIGEIIPKANYKCIVNNLPYEGLVKAEEELAIGDNGFIFKKLRPLLEATLLSMDVLKTVFRFNFCGQGGRTILSLLERRDNKNTDSRTIACQEYEVPDRVGKIVFSSIKSIVFAPVIYEEAKKVPLLLLLGSKQLFTSEDMLLVSMIMNELELQISENVTLWCPR